MRAMIRFGKQPRLRFISHLDLQRFFQRALNRTGLPVKYTQGFNPHPVMSFASALALGWTSEYEVRRVDDRHPAPMALVCAADYAISLSGAGAEAALQAVDEFLAREQVMAVRKTKSGEREVDVRPLAIELVRDGAGLRARLKLTERDALKPDLLVRTLADIAGAEEPEARIHRLCLLGADESGALRPLMSL